jgi:N6-adenosine-specific RNA methylase IME4
VILPPGTEIRTNGRDLFLEPVPLYRCVAIDPPWLERGAGKIKRGADRHYNLMHTDGIIALLRFEIEPKLANDCHLWLWVTNNYLPDGLLVMSALGFRYVTNLVWVKDRIGLGQYLRGQHELCLFGTRGATSLPPIRNVPSALFCKKGAHSAKPQEAFDMIERVSPGPRLEVFAREKRPGWDAWGDQAPA